MTRARCASLGHLCSAPTTFIGGFGKSGLIPLLYLCQLQQSRNSSLLSYEEVSAGSPTPEHPVARPSRTLLVLHGLLGCGRNWRSWSRRLVEAAAATHPPEGGPWRALLLDLRCHGGSAQRPGLHPPNNMLSAAEDVSRLVRHLMGAHSPGAVLGHSMGGKVALALVQQATAAAAARSAAAVAASSSSSQHSSSSPSSSSSSRAPAVAAAMAGAPPGTAAAAIAAATTWASDEWCSLPRQLWVLDSQPGLVAADVDAGTGISRVLNTVHSVPLPVPNRTWLLRHLRDSGLSDALAQWLASNLVPLPVTAAAAAAASGHVVTTHQHQQHQLRHQHHEGGDQQQRNPQQLQYQHKHHGAGSAPVATHGGSSRSSSRSSSRDGPLTWSFDIQCAGAMYMSYRTTEFWQVLENPPYGTAVHLVQGARSDRWPEAMQGRLSQAVAAAATATATVAHPRGAGETAVATAAAPGATAAAALHLRGSFQHHVLDRAGHWLHVDNPEGLLKLVLPRLSEL